MRAPAVMCTRTDMGMKIERHLHDHRRGTTDPRGQPTKNPPKNNNHSRKPREKVKHSFVSQFAKTGS